MVPKAALSYVSGSYSRAYLSFGTDKITEEWMDDNFKRKEWWKNQICSK